MPINDLGDVAHNIYPYQQKTKKGTFYKISFRYFDTSINKRKQKWLQGFETKKAARQGMYDFLLDHTPTNEICNLPFPEYIEVFKKDRFNQYKSKTQQNKYYNYKNHLIPNFQCRVNEITPLMINEFNSMLLAEFKVSTVQTIFKELKNLLNHAERYYDLNPNPIKKVKTPTKAEFKEKKPTWTVEDFNKVDECQ
jgi:hypothetical protein